VIIAEVIFKNATQMLVIDDDHMIQALATNASDHPLHVAILPRTSWCNANLLDAHSFNPRPEELPIDSVAVATHKLRSAVFRKCFDDLLCGPNRRWMLRDIDNAVDKNGETPMHGAAYKGMASAVFFLAEKGANVELWNRKNKRGWTPLDIAEGVVRGMDIVGSPRAAAAIQEVMKNKRVEK
jgi:hypothetical protein